MSLSIGYVKRVRRFKVPAKANQTKDKLLSFFKKKLAQHNFNTKNKTVSYQPFAIGLLSYQNYSRTITILRYANRVAYTTCARCNNLKTLQWRHLGNMITLDLPRPLSPSWCVGLKVNFETYIADR